MDNLKFGKFIADCRKEKQMTQKELAEKLHLTDKAISKWERGLSFPDITILEDLARSLEISIVELMNSEKIEKEEMNSQEVENVLNNSFDYSKEQIKRKKKKWKIGILIVTIIFISILTIIGRNLYLAYPEYDPEQEWSQEYIIGEGNIKGEVDITKTLGDNPDYEIGATARGYAVFKNPEKAYQQIKKDCSLGIKAIQKEFNLPPYNKFTCEIYGRYGWQLTKEKNEEAIKQAKKINIFMDIYKNSLKDKDPAVRFY